MAGTGAPTPQEERTVHTKAPSMEGRGVEGRTSSKASCLLPTRSRMSTDEAPSAEPSPPAGTDAARKAATVGSSLPGLRRYTPPQRSRARGGLSPTAANTLPLGEETGLRGPRSRSRKAPAICSDDEQQACEPRGAASASANISNEMRRC